MQVKYTHQPLHLLTGDCAVDNSGVYMAVYLAQAYQAFLRLCTTVGAARFLTLQQTSVSLFLYHRFLMYASSRSRGKRLTVRQYSGTCYSLLSQNCCTSCLQYKTNARNCITSSNQRFYIITLTFLTLRLFILHKL